MSRRRVGGWCALVLAYGWLPVTAPPAVGATTRQVPAQYPTIQSALNAAESGDTIVVGPGEYDEHLDFLSKSLSLVSSHGAAATVIDAKSSPGRAVEMRGDSSLVGFTITGGEASFGAGVEIWGSGVIAENIFRSNAQESGGYGAAIGINGGSPLIRSNWFEHNSCDNQWHAGVVSSVNTKSPVVINNVFVDNACNAVSVTGGQGVQVVNNTMVGNRTAIRLYSAAPGLYRNNLLSENVTGFKVDLPPDDPAELPKIDHNLVWQNVYDYENLPDLTGTAGNLRGDPLFLDADSGDLRVYVGSPAVDSGENAESPTVDLLGHGRPIDADWDGTATVDIGAYELPRGSDPPVIASARDAEVLEGSDPLELRVVLSQSAPTTIQLPFHTVDGTAVTPADYTSRTGIVTFEPGQTRRRILVDVVDDRTDEAHETLQVELGNAHDVIVEDRSASGTIIDDDYGPRISVDDVHTLEGDDDPHGVRFRVSLARASDHVITAGFATMERSADRFDFARRTGTLSFPPGTMTQFVRVPIRGDRTPEPDERFNLELLLLENARPGRMIGVGKIYNDD